MIFDTKFCVGYSDIAYSHTAQSLRENIDDLCHLHARIPAHSEVKILFPNNHVLISFPHMRVFFMVLIFVIV